MQAELVAALRTRLNVARIPYLPYMIHLVPGMMGDLVDCRWLSDLPPEEFGIYIQPINYPTVPRDTEWLRILPSPVHSVVVFDLLTSTLKTL